MTTGPRIFAYGTVSADTDSWLLVSEHVIALDVNLLVGFDGSLEHQTVSVVGTMGIPRSAPGQTKLIVERLASHNEIKRRAYEIHQSGQHGSAVDHWLRAERELLSL
jgi:Protein of unknown function (DUF2934)